MKFQYIEVGMAVAIAGVSVFLFIVTAGVTESRTRVAIVHRVPASESFLSATFNQQAAVLSASEPALKERERVEQEEEVMGQKKIAVEEKDENREERTSDFVSAESFTENKLPAQNGEEQSDGISEKFFSEVVSLVLQNINQERTRAGETPLQSDDELVDVAKTKADDMVERTYYAHADPDGCDLMCLLERAGLKARAWGENLMQYRSTGEVLSVVLAEQTVSSWIESSGHRDNVLSPLYTHVGIAVAKTGDTYYVVAHFVEFPSDME